MAEPYNWKNDLEEYIRHGVRHRRLLLPPLLTGVTFDGYDKSIVRVVGGLLISVSPGTTRVTVHWHNFSDSFVVTVTE